MVCVCVCVCFVFCELWCVVCGVVLCVVVWCGVVWCWCVCGVCVCVRVVYVYVGVCLRMCVSVVCAAVCVWPIRNCSAQPPSTANNWVFRRIRSSSSASRKAVRACWRTQECNQLGCNIMTSPSCATGLAMRLPARARPMWEMLRLSRSRRLTRRRKPELV